MAAQMKQMSPGMVKFMGQAAGAVQTGLRAAKAAQQWLASRQLFVVALVVLLVAVLLRWLGLM